MKRFLALILLIVTAFAFASCAGKAAYTGSRSNGTSSFSGGYNPSPKYSPSIADDSSYKGGSGYELTGGGLSGEEAYSYDGETTSGLEGKNQIRAGQLTAKAQNDNGAYEDWKLLFASASENQKQGAFYRYQSDRNEVWACNTEKRVKVTVKNGEEPVVGATVTYCDPKQVSWTARTDISGVAYLFPKEDEGALTISSGKGTASATFTAENRDLAIDLSENEAHANLVKIMFVIDATGSMGDEMDYLAAELADVIHRVAAQANGVKIDLALLFYRDDGDQEKFAYSDFETVSQEAGLKKQLKVLDEQYATGGGDTPEAVDEALVLAAEKNWGEENSTKLMFLVLDAPSHQTVTNRNRTSSAVKTAAEKGIRICPVLCSGADLFCEYVTRTAAILTGGTSIFITDDSGIGGSHLDPDLPEVTVEKLNDLLVRLIVGYHTGDFGEAKAWNAGEKEKPGPQTSFEDSAPEADPAPTATAPTEG